MIELLLQKYSEPKTRLSQYELDSTTFILLHLHSCQYTANRYEEVELRRQTPIVDSFQAIFVPYTLGQHFFRDRLAVTQTSSHMSIFSHVTRFRPT